MDKVRIGIIGMGNMGRFHANDLLDGKVPRGELAAVGSTSPHKLEEYKEKGVQIFGSGEEMIASGAIDALLIATPHYQHTSLGVAALEAGLHIMVEKPISAHKADAERLIAAAAARPDQVFGAMFQLRVEPRYQKIRELVQGGELGDLVRVLWIMTDWFRSEAYFQSGGWRATWKGEGGGVLLNQCLHQLDAMQWITGMPSKVRSHVGIGRWHDIEVEDDVTCYMEFANGASGAFITSSGETPGSNRFEIAGTKGRLILENDTLTLTRNEVPSDEWCKTSKIGFQKPETTVEEIPIPGADAAHATLMTNFVNAILDGEALIAPGVEGLGSVELANVMVYSGLLNESVDLPMDGAAWEAKLNELIANSTHEKKVVEVSSEDFAASFRK
ncbi:MAG: Gfo/Idh/MocA family oxidoreductase [Pedosphaera sp.]|nr:Gfo/Idh/MocA family oxidoreductase [Pedosphaera sp.]|tara:strand:- start:135 stop:1295 length:1161 start_codon:yes stop_codon:yes gene_type:complete